MGKPFNIASYGLLTMMVAQVCGFKVVEFVHALGDAHLYSNHFDQVATQLSLTPGALPVMKINPSVNGLFVFTFDDFTLEGYEAAPSIAAPLAVYYIAESVSSHVRGLFIQYCRNIV